MAEMHGVRSADMKKGVRITSKSYAHPAKHARKGCLLHGITIAVVAARRSYQRQCVGESDERGDDVQFAELP